MPSAPLQTTPDLYVQRGEDPRVAYVAFTGGVMALMLRPFDFMDVTGILPYSRILLRDPSRMWFHSGVDADSHDFESLVESVQRRLREIGAEKVFCIGTSMGGYAAVLAGHMMRADYVHAFAPQTYLDAGNIRKYGDKKLGASGNLPGLHQRLGPDAACLDLRRVLERSNGKTKYFVHVCAGCEIDLQRAKHLEGAPDLAVLPYPCSVHTVLVGMAHKRFLHTVLDPQAQGDLLARHAALFDGMPMQRQPDLTRDNLGRIAVIVRKVGRGRLSEAGILGCPDLLARLSLDSMDCLEIIVGLESEFGVEIDPEFVKLEDFRTVASMLTVVWGAMSPSAGGA